MLPRILACALCALVSPALGQSLLIQDGDYYPRLQFTGASILMTGGRVDEMDIFVDLTRIEGGEVSGRIMAQAGNFEFVGGQVSASIFCWLRSCDVKFEGYSFRSYKFVSERDPDNYWYHVEGVLSDGGFVTIGLRADSVEGGADIAPHFTLLDGFAPGDTDNDFDVDLADLNSVRNNFGMLTNDRTAGDLDGDGEVGLSDLNDVRNHFGAAAPFTLGPEYDIRNNPVPEPPTMVLLSLFGLAGILKSVAHARRRFHDALKALSLLPSQ